MNADRVVEEAVCQIPPGVRPVESVRGTILFLDWTWLRTHGRYEQYAARVEPEYRDVLDKATTSDWLPVAFLQAHYRALDALQLSYADAFDVGRLVGERAHGAFLATILRLAGSLGASPWFALGHAHRMWERSWRGGGIAVFRAGPRAARVESRANPTAGSPFHRASFSGAFSVGMEALAKKTRIEEIPSARTPDSFSLMLEWF